MYKAVIHLPQKQEDVEKLMREIACFRADKTLKVLREQGVTPEQLKQILADIKAQPAQETH